MGRGCVASLRDWAGSESHLLTIGGLSSRLGATRSNTQAGWCVLPLSTCLAPSAGPSCPVPECRPPSLTLGRLQPAPALPPHGEGLVLSLGPACAHFQVHAALLRASLAGAPEAVSGSVPEFWGAGSVYEASPWAPPLRGLQRASAVAVLGLDI